MRSENPAGVSTHQAIIRAAIRNIAQDGPGVSLRKIAADAGVTAPAILHHFGSRAGLIAECDQEVAAAASEARFSILDVDGGTEALMAQIRGVASYSEMIGYAARTLQSGGAAARALIERATEFTAQWLRHGERTGAITPSRFPEIRAQLLTEFKFGSLLIELSTRDAIDLDDLPAIVREYTARVSGPLLELLTEGVFTQSTYLDTYLNDRHADEPARGTEN